MKRSTRGLLMAGLAFFITGVALGIASLSAGFRYEDFAEAVEQGKFRLVGPEKWTVGVRTALSDAADEGNWLERTYTGVESLDLNVGQADCEIILCDGQEWSVRGEQLPSRFRCSLDDDELRVDCGGSFLGSLPGFREKSTARIKVYIPRDQILKEADLETGVGKISMPVDGEFLKCRDLSLKCGVGETDLCVDVRGETKVECGVGKVRMTVAGRPEEYNYDVEYGAGDLTIDGESYSGLLGGDYERDNGADRELKIECGVGSMELVFAETGMQPAGEADGGAGTMSPDEYDEEDVQSLDGHHEEEDVQFPDEHDEEDAPFPDEHHEEEDVQSSNMHHDAEGG